MATILRASVTSLVEDPQDGDPVSVLIDGSDTPVTANGLTGYIPTPGDRLLLTQVGTQVEVMQFVSRGTVPYVAEADLSDLRSEVDLNSDDIATTSTDLSIFENEMGEFETTTNDALATFQTKYEALGALGEAGLDIDFFWVGETDTTVVKVPISQFVQGAVGAPTAEQFTDAINVWDKDQIGNIEDFSDTDQTTPPMSTFYDVFVANGRQALPYK